MGILEKIRNVVLFALCPAVVSLTLTIVNYTAIAEDGSYTVPIEISRKTDQANVTTINGVGVTAQILNLDKLNADDTEQFKNTEGVDTDIKTTYIYNSIAGDIKTWGGRISSDDFKKYQYDLESVNGVIVNSVVDKENGTVTYTFNNGQAIISDVNKEPDKQKSFTRDIPDGMSSRVEKVDDHSTKTIYDNGVVKLETVYVDGIEPPTKDDANNKPIKLNYKISWCNIMIGYVYAILIEIIACLICFIITRWSNYFKLRKNGQVM